MVFAALAWANTFENAPMPNSATATTARQRTAASKTRRLKKADREKDFFFIAGRELARYRRVGQRCNREGDQCNTLGGYEAPKRAKICSGSWEGLGLWSGLLEEPNPFEGSVSASSDDAFSSGRKRVNTIYACYQTRPRIDTARDEGCLSPRLETAQVGLALTWEP